MASAQLCHRFTKTMAQPVRKPQLLNNRGKPDLSSFRCSHPASAAYREPAAAGNSPVAVPSSHWTRCFPSSPCCREPGDSGPIYPSLIRNRLQRASCRHCWSLRNHRYPMRLPCLRPCRIQERQLQSASIPFSWKYPQLVPKRRAISRHSRHRYLSRGGIESHAIVTRNGTNALLDV